MRSAGKGSDDSNVAAEAKLRKLMMTMPLVQQENGSAGGQELCRAICRAALLRSVKI
jgi:hypothetical protein